MNSYFLVEGKRKLYGNFYPQGNKNEALAILASVLLTTQKIKIYNIPLILDVLNMIDILKSLGVTVEKIGTNSFEFQAKEINIDNMHFKKIQTLRGSLMLIGSLIHRVQKFKFPETGGDNIGIRSINTHLFGLKSFGVSIQKDQKNKYYIFKSPEKIIGQNILLEESSVTGTANMIMIAVLAKGETTILNSASEPHIQQLCHFLNYIGADIKGIGTNFLSIQGKEELFFSNEYYEHHIHPDYLEIGSIIALAALTSSEIQIKNVIRKDLIMILHIFKKFGIEPIFSENDLIIEKNQKMKINSKFLDYSNAILKIDDGPWPNFPADMISMIVVTATQCHGSVLIFEKMFESRLFFVDKLIKMGAGITLCDPHRVVINGKRKLYAQNLTSPDIRAGIAILIAALCAKGTSRIDHIEQIDRGYENIEIRLNAINAKIDRFIEK